MRKMISFILVCGIMMTIFTGCALLDNFGEDSVNNDELTPASSVTMSEDEANGLKDKTPVQLYFINEQGKLSQETRYIKITDSNKGNEFLATVVLKELINGPAKGSLLQASIPKGTTVRTAVTIKDGIATVNLSKEFIDKHPGGKKNEQLTLYSIVNTLTEIKDIKSVQFKIDGKIKKEFKGSYQIDVAYPRTAYLINAQPEGNTISKIEAPKDNILKPKENIVQPKESIEKPKENIVQPKESIEKPKENIVQPKENIEKSKDNTVQPAKEENKEPVKEDTTKDKKTNIDINDDEDVETNAEILE